MNLTSLTSPSDTPSRPILFVTPIRLVATMVLVVAWCSFTAPAKGAEEAAANQARIILEAAGVQGGLVAMLGSDDGKLAAALRKDERYLVHCLETDPLKVAAARNYLQSLGLYGKVSVMQWSAGKLPYTDNLVNLLIAEKLGPISMEEVMRALAPLGVAYVKNGSHWERAVKPWPKEIDEWTHFLHGPDNNAVANDTVVAAPRAIQWQTEPRWGRSHEELASMSAAVTAKGRVFFIADEAPLASIRFDGQWSLIARDAFNGKLLWSKPIVQWVDHLRHFRAGPTHLPRRLVAMDDVVYVTLGLMAPVTALNGASGEVIRVFEGTERTEEIVCDGSALFLVVGTSEANRVGGGLQARGEPEPSEFRYILALDAQTGRRKWQKAFDAGEYLLPLTLAVGNGKVYYQSTKGVACLDADSGREVWSARRATVQRRMSFSAPTLVATQEVILCADRAPSEKEPPSDGQVEYAVHGWNEKGFNRNAKCVVTAYAAEDGAELWSAPCSEGYNSPVDVFVVGDTVWVGSERRAYQLRTGAPADFKLGVYAPVGMAHHRCYRDKATVNYLLTGKSGIELVSVKDGWQGNNSWIRGTCQYGIMPANGLLYAPPNACACFSQVKVTGFFAAAPRRVEGATDASYAGKLERGLAFEQAVATGNGMGEWAADSWPMYRHDVERSGVVATQLPERLSPRWETRLGGRLTQPVVAGGVVFVAATDAHTVYALGAKDGMEKWRFTAGGRIDSSPTVYKGLVYFGSADGWLYCLRTADGEVVWRFRGGPAERLVGVYDQLESVWPIHGSVLIQNDSVYVAAGRSSYLDGGMRLYRLAPLTGEVLARSVIYDLDPVTGRQTGKESRGSFDMEGVVTDILVGDGESVYLQHMRFDRDCRQLEEERPHLVAATGLLGGEDWFVRSYWVIGSETGAGWGRWASAAQQAPYGRILAFDKERVYGYGREGIQSAATGHKADTYRLFAMKLGPTSGDDVDASKQRRSTSSPKGKAGAGEMAALWSDKESLIVRAMVLVRSATAPGEKASDKLLVAGPPDLGKKNTGTLSFANNAEALAGFNGEKGVFLRVVSGSDGGKLAECQLDAMPVFDGMSAAEGSVFIALRNGAVQCWGARQ